MAIKITVGKVPVYSLTSRPEQPKPYPPEGLIAHKAEFEDRAIVVTVPFPDTIELTLDLLNEHQVTPDTSHKSAKQIYAALDEDIQAALPEVAASVGSHITCSKLTKAETIFMIGYSDLEPLHRARLTLRRRQSTDFGSWSIRLEFSAAKAQPAGLMKLTAALGEVLPFLNVASLFPDFRVSRVDPAIDLIGARPLDLIAHIPKPGKRLVYVGADGQPESVYLYEAKPPLKKPPATLSYNTRGTLRLKLYERSAYCQQHMMTPPYGTTPVTRSEVEMRWKKKTQRPLLRDLGDIGNLFHGRRVAYAPGVADQLGIANAKSWIRFCLAVFGGGVSKSQSKWSVGAGLKLRQAYEVCKGDLISDTAWKRWGDGLDQTGLSAWIKIAQGAG